MAPRSDTARGLRPARICEFAGVIRQTRDKWVDRGLLSARVDCGELDVVELVALKTLYASVRKSHVPIAWTQVQPKLRETIPATGFVLVWDVQARRASFAHDATQVFQLVTHGRPVQVVDLATPIDLARKAFRNEVDAGRSDRLRPPRSRTRLLASSERGSPDDVQ
jgi:hypothetical protein